MVGYATRETETFMPYEYEEARTIVRELWNKYPEARDMKSQVTTED
jgi:S-adenosylmethionine synthetase